MKNQYFGDLNDYRKYALLRQLSQGGRMRIAVCWMLTPDEARTDGSRTGYLLRPERWRQYDQELFDCLRECLLEKRSRRVSRAEEAGIIPGAVYHDRLLSDDGARRLPYLEEILRIAAGCDILFFDPDNGLAVKSVPYGRKGSSKYLYWEELQRAASAGCSLLVYQHFPHVKRAPYILRLSQRVLDSTGMHDVTVFQTPTVMYLLIALEKHRDYLRERSSVVAARWGHEILTHQVIVS